MLDNPDLYSSQSLILMDIVKCVRNTVQRGLHDIEWPHQRVST